MKKITLFLTGIFLITSCSSAKKIQREISYGNYDNAIEFALKKLRRNPTKKSNQPIIKMLEKAYDKAVAQDYRNLEKYRIDSNHAVIEDIYNTYLNLDRRQELIKPVLPLHINAENRNALFIFKDYNQEIQNSKNSLTDFLFANAKQLLSKNNKKNARKAYNDLRYLKQLNSNYKNVDSLLEEAHFLGTNFVNVTLINDTQQIIPMRLEQDLLNFDSYGLDDFWTVFDSDKRENIKYDYELALLFKRIDISPERIIENTISISKTIKDGYEYVYDDNGNVKLDSLGHKIKVDKLIDVTANFHEIHQEKASHIIGEVIVTNLNNNREITNFPLESEFIFINDFGELEGDKRALETAQLELLNHQAVPFPSTEQMVYDTGEDLKAKLKGIIEDIDF
ncbi:MAG TPA: hypothetical protein ENK67_04225 [Flavobacteriia bacterium]|nr:hypothetical protein [Flavobacteriia bacterium]